jgi:hypothetical protein
LAGLTRIGLVGAAVDTGLGPGFLVGPSFLQWITFMGCSPQIELAPPADGGSFCCLRLLGPFAVPQLLHGADTQPPRCAACRGRLLHWQTQLPRWLEQPAARSVACPHCAVSIRPLDLVWRQRAGWGRLFVTVEDIFPGEAVPVPNLLAELKRATGVGWQYFYQRD